ncbi:malectin domain-containing carbohydrate-binding protein [Pseudarthrobacter sp. NPDC092424]|uniref:malectin domain-containing carbohydrate-binding protein n=1 Tax=Pseudarthrobacter sp. NPDC092424 TaxID=3364415 RepID=UPI00381797C2
MTAALVSASPARSLDPFDPDEPGTWQSSPYSPLGPADLVVTNNTTRLTFESQAGLPAADGRGTGFTLLQPSTAHDGGPFFVPADLTVASGFLHVTASSGSTLLDSNSQDNALGVGLVPAAATIRISATLDAPRRLQPATEAGVWLGPDDDNLVRLFLTGSDDAGTWEMKLQRERDGESEAASQDLISVPLHAVPQGRAVKLVLDVDPAAEAVLASYQVGADAPVNIGRMEVPANFLDGTLLTASGAGGAKSLAGIFATAAGEPAGERPTVSFDDFSAKELPSTAKPAPASPGSPAKPTAEPGAKPSSSPAPDPGQLPSPSPSAPPSTSQPPSPPAIASPLEDAPAPSGSLPATRPAAPPGSGPGPAPAESTTGAGPADGIDSSPATKEGASPNNGCLEGEWRVEYFFGTSLEGSPVVTGCDAAIDQDFLPGAGPEGVGSENYSTRWVKVLHAGAGDYSFAANADDGVRITIDGDLLIDAWKQDIVGGPHTAEVSLDGGAHVVAVEYFQAGGAASVQAGYSKDGADTEPPIPASGLTTRGGPSAVHLSWKASGSKDVAGYRVYRGTRHGVDVTLDPLSGDEPVTGTSFSDTSAQAGTTYYYTVVALDAAGNDSSASNEAAGSLAAADTTPPPAPSGLTAASGDTRVSLSWTAPSAADIAGYRVYRSLQPVVKDTGSLHSGPALVTAPAYEDTTATNGTTYFYVVSAVDLSGNESGVSNEVHAVPVVPNSTNIRVDFTVTSGVPASGYAADWGEAFSARTGPNQGTGLTYGWKTPDGNPLSLVGNGRDRNRTGVDARLDSIIHMQYGDDPGTNGVKTEGIWEAAVPDGLYRVTVAVGDQAFSAGYNSVHAINVEAGVGIEKFQGSAAQEYQTTTVIAGVWDGALTITASGGTNTKLAYIDIVGMERAPHIDTMRPENRSTGQDPTDGVSATIRVPYAGVGVDASTLPGNVHIYEVASGSEVPSSTGTSGGNDVIATQPTSPLKPDTTYRFTVTSGVKDNYGAPFIPFTSIFTTGHGGISAGADYTPLTGVSFTKVEQPAASGKYWSSMAFGPDGKLYASTIGQGLFRFAVAADGSLSAMEDLGYAGRAIIGLVFDRTGTAASPKLWITSTSANTYNEQGEWISGVSMLSGPALQTESRVFTGLPRSQADHLTNSMAYGRDGRLYFMQGSNQGAGDLDNSWGQRGEKLLTAAALVFDPADPAVQQAITSGTPINVQTSGGGTYDPYAPGAPLKIYATGIRNAYDLVWHSNGHLYVPTNGTAGGANSPGVTQNPDGTYTRVAAEGIPGYSSVNGQDVTRQCQRRSYTGGTAPAVGNQPTQRDFLFDVVEGGYYGHPNPERCEWILNEGNDPLNPPTAPGQGGSKYPSGTKADPNYRGFSYDFGFNKSPNGSIEYKSSTFGGQLKGRLIVTRFSNNNDLLFLQVDPATGKVLGEQTSLGISGVPNSAISGVDGFNDPLEVVEDPKTGNLYVNQYDRSGSNQAMFLLKVPSAQQAAPLTSSVSEMVFSAVKSTVGPTKSVTITNTGSASATLSTSIAGTNPAEFSFNGGNGTTLSPGATTTIQVTFKPGTTVGQRQAVLRIAAAGSTLDVGLYGLTMNGLEGLNEPPFQDVAGTLGYKINVGWSTLEGGTQATAKGDELLEPLFLKAGTQPVSMVPLAQYAPREDLPFGWYTGDGTPAQLHKLGSIDISGYQSLLPPSSPGTLQTFDPGTQSFGFYYYSNAFQRTGYTEDRLNSGGVAHRARVYPAKDRTGTPMANSFIVAFEDASNGDYQDYVFLVQGVRPASGGATPPATGAFKVNFSNLAAGLPTGYFRDFGEPFGARTRTDQGTGLSYGWKNQATGAPIDLSTAGTAGPGNGRLRTTSQPDLRLNTLMHMQGADVPSFNGVPAYAFWEAAVPNGDYDVTITVGDPVPQTATELHTINLEGRKIIDRFAPSGDSGSATRHQTAATRVTVTDGLLTVDAQGGINTKIDYIDVVPAPTDPGGDPTVGAQVKVNFQTAGAPTPTGWIPDTGAAFLAQRKFGWLAGGAPADRSSATRYRTAATAGIAYPADPLLQTLNIMGPASNVSTGVWEYAVPDGTYTVAASAGDAGYLDSAHGILAEGQPLIANFVPTGSTPFQTGSRQITVADGKLTLSSSGTNTKINWVSIKGAGLDTQPDPVPTAKYNFTLPSAVTPTGWIADYGGMYDGDGYGWFVNGTPTDRTLEARNRPSATPGITYPAGDPLLQSLVQMQTASKGGTDGIWQRAIPNGTYEVTASVGDSGYLDSVHALKVEETQLIAPFTPTGTSPFASGTASVDVTDGKLTLTPTGTNTKINWVTIKGPNLLNPLPADTTAPAPPTGLTATVGTNKVTLNWSANTEPDLAGYHVERATALAGPWTRLTGTTPVTATAYTDTAPPAASAVYYRIIALDTSANASAPSATAQANTTATSPPATRINTGGPAVTTGGLNWLADTYFTGGKTYTNALVTQIAGTTDDSLYLNERSGKTAFGYAIPVPSGTYTVKLHFAEIWHGATGGGPGGTGKRIFTVNLEAGTPEITNLDLNAVVAPMTAYIRTQQLTVTDGTLNIDFTATTDEPTIAAIEIIPGGTADTTAPAPPTGLTATVGTNKVTLNWSANTEPDLAGYHVERATALAGPWTRLTGTTPVTATAYTDTAPPAASAVYYRIIALDTSANASAPSATAQANTTATSPPATRINTGGPAVTTGGLNWLADTYFTGGKTYTNALVTQIAGTTDDSLYLNERSGKTAFGYAIPVPSGTYTVKLHFAEIWHGATGGGPGGTGKRIFTVNLEAGTPEITNLDLNAVVAPMTAYIRTQQLTVTDGTLNIDFTATTDEPTIAAIEIIPGSV